MLRWMIKSLFLEPLTLIVAITSAASAFLLIIMFEGIFAGESEQIVAYVRNVKADVWVMQRGVSNMHMATSYLPDWKVRQVSELPGVAGVPGPGSRRGEPRAARRAPARRRTRGARGRAGPARWNRGVPAGIEDGTGLWIGVLSQHPGPGFLAGR